VTQRTAADNGRTFTHVNVLVSILVTNCKVSLREKVRAKMVGEQTSVFLAAFLFSVVMTSYLTEGYYIHNPSILYRSDDETLDRDKRYTESQDRASAFCTGMCMYEQRKSYGDCYDLCNWNGKGPSPWLKFARTSDVDADAADGNSMENLQALMRTGGGGTKLKPRRKPKN